MKIAEHIRPIPPKPPRVFDISELSENELAILVACLGDMTMLKLRGKDRVANADAIDTLYRDLSHALGSPTTDTTTSTLGDYANYELNELSDALDDPTDRRIRHLIENLRYTGGRIVSGPR